MAFYAPNGKAIVGVLQSAVPATWAISWEDDAVPIDYVHQECGPDSPDWDDIEWHGSPVFVDENGTRWLAEHLISEEEKAATEGLAMSRTLFAALQAQVKFAQALELMSEAMDVFDDAVQDVGDAAAAPLNAGKMVAIREALDAGEASLKGPTEAWAVKHRAIRTNAEAVLAGVKADTSMDFMGEMVKAVEPAAQYTSSEIANVLNGMVSLFNAYQKSVVNGWPHAGTAEALKRMVDDVERVSAQRKA